MELYDVMRTTFAAREFIDEPVPDSVVQRILENARFAPSGGNRQGWHVLVIREEQTREAMLPMIMPTFQRYLAQVQAGEAPWNTIDQTQLSDAEIAAFEPPEGFIRQVLAAPVLLLIVVDLSVVASFDSQLERIGVISGASIYPFVWNVLLSARNEGYGGTLTTFIAGREDDAKKLLGNYAELWPTGKIALRFREINVASDRIGIHLHELIVGKVDRAGAATSSVAKQLRGAGYKRAHALADESAAQLDEARGGDMAAMVREVASFTGGAVDVVVVGDARSEFASRMGAQSVHDRRPYHRASLCSLDLRATTTALCCIWGFHFLARGDDRQWQLWVLRPSDGGVVPGAHRRQAPPSRRRPTGSSA